MLPLRRTHLHACDQLALLLVPDLATSQNAVFAAVHHLVGYFAKQRGHPLGCAVVPCNLVHCHDGLHQAVQTVQHLLGAATVKNLQTISNIVKNP